MAATYSPTWYSSTIGANGLNFSVRNGKRWIPVAIATLIFVGLATGILGKERDKLVVMLLSYKQSRWIIYLYV